MFFYFRKFKIKTFIFRKKKYYKELNNIDKIFIKINIYKFSNY